FIRLDRRTRDVVQAPSGHARGEFGQARGQGVSEQRMGTFYCDINPLDAYDAIVHLPRVTAAEPDDDALAASPREVQETFARWERR
ncbi:hypothetical protein K7G98_40750, partial [Saccharothrix sp. MB29]|nr:hypothetical protein [Saccharothrix sp. MB29]